MPNAVVVVGIAVALLTIGCSKSQRSPRPSTGTVRDSADQVMYGARSVLAFNGVRRGEASGDTVMSFDAGTRFEFRGLRALFTTSLGRPLGTLTAPTGTVKVPTTALAAHGRVTIVSDTSHRRIESADVRYDVAANQFASDSAFVATAGTKKLTGVGFTADPGLFSVKCLQRCTGTLGP